MEDLIPINLLIADRTYRIKTLPKDEETIRKTVKIINDKIIEFKTQFAGKDMQDYIAMVIIWYATQAHQVSESPEMQPQLLAALSLLEAQMDNAINPSSF